MNRLIHILLVVFGSGNCFAWEPYQQPATSIITNYDIFKPFGKTSVQVEISEKGVISKLKIKTEKRKIVIPVKDLAEFKYPSLPDMEIMSFGEATEDGIGGSFSLCIPYGHLERMESSGYWQRPVFSIAVGPDSYRIVNVPLPKNGTHFGESNGCESAGLEVYGL